MKRSRQAARTAAGSSGAQNGVPLGNANAFDSAPRFLRSVRDLGNLAGSDNGNTSGIGPEAWESLRRTRVFLKAPITTPQGGGVKSLNVTIRKTLGLFANVRPAAPTRPPSRPTTRGWTW